MTPSIFVTIMGIRKRKDNIERIIEKLHEESSPFLKGIYISWDTRMQGTIYNNRNCWTHIDPSCSHQLLLQDDAYPCSNFFSHLIEILSLFPSSILSFFYGANFSSGWKHAIAQQCHFFSYSYGLTGTSILLPTEIVFKYLLWHDLSLKYLNCTRENLQDDERISLFQKLHSLPTIFPYPELIKNIGLISTLNHKIPQEPFSKFLDDYPSAINWSANISAMKTFSGKLDPSTEKKILNSITELKVIQ